MRIRLFGVATAVIALLVAGVAPTGWTAEHAPTKAELDRAFSEAVSFTFGQSRESLTVIADAVRNSQHSPADRKALEKRLTDVLKSKATLDCKRFVCKQLYLIGTEDSVPAVARLLKNEDTADMARYALERMPAGEVVDKVFRNALPKTSGRVKVGVVNSIGNRRIVKAVPALVKLLSGGDTELAEASAAALGSIGGTQAADALAKACGSASPAIQATVKDAYLRCGDRFLSDGDSAAAEHVFAALYKANEPDSVRVAAFKGLVRARGRNGLTEVAKVLRGNDMAVKRAAMVFVRTLPGTGATETFATILPSLDAESQVLALRALADRGDPAALSAVATAARSSDEQVRLAALAGLARLGNASTVPLLVKTAATTSGKERDIARHSLDRLRGAGVDGALAAALDTAEGSAKTELIRSLAARNAYTAVPRLMTLAQDEDPAVQSAAFKALGALGTEKDLPALLKFLVKGDLDKSRRDAEKAVVAVTRRQPESSDRVAPVLAALKSTRKRAAKVSLVRVLAEVGDNAGLDAVRAAAKKKRKKNAELRDAAIRGLAKWPTKEVLPDLENLAADAKDETHRVLALRGYIRLIGTVPVGPKDQALERYKRAMKLATRKEEKRAVLSGVAEIRDEKALAFVQSFLTDPDLKEEAAKAQEKLKKDLGK